MADEKTPLTEAERTLHAEYVVDLKKRGFCKMDPATSGSTILFNRFDGEREALSFIGNDFNKWLAGRECDNRSTVYILKGLPHISGQRFVPNGPDFIIAPRSRRTFANTYRRYEPTLDDADCDPLFHELFERMFPDKQERHTVLQWIAHMFQRPQERPSWHMMFPSDTGTGKGFLVNDMLTPLVLHTSTVRNYAQIMGKFSGVLANDLLVLIDDAKAKSDATQTELKSLLSEERTYVEQKYGSAGMVDTYTRIILASNEDRPLFLDANERRWYVTAKIRHRKDREDTAKFIAKLAAWLALPGSLCKVYNFFMRYDLTGFHHKQVPPSPGLAAMVEMSRDPWAEGIKEWTADSPVFTYAELKAGLLVLGLSLPGDTRLGHLIREAGFVKRRTLIDGKQINLYRPADMSDDDARRIREAEPAF
jgi:hypothetical protein